MKKAIYIAVCIITVTFCSSLRLFAAEHPGEHPGKPVAKEHHGQEHQGEAISADEIRKAIENYAKSDSRLKGGYFLLYDPKDRAVLQLQFVQVHERASYIKKEKAYFACADFKSAEGKTAYDLDFWMRAKGHHDQREELEVYKVVIHKKDGVPRFTYKDDEIAPVEKGKMAPEEHT